MDAVGGGGESRGGLGPSEQTVRQLWLANAEPAWLLAKRLEAVDRLAGRPMPDWDPELADVSFADPGPLGRAAPPVEDGDTLPLDLERRGVVVCPLARAIREHSDLVRDHLGSVAPSAGTSIDDGFPADEVALSAVNASLWSTGTFVYVPPGVAIEIPIQARPRAGAVVPRRFERTLLVADAGSRVDYIEGCAAPTYSADPLRSAVVEVVVKPGAEVVYTSVQNRSANVSNLVIERAVVEAGGRMEWVMANFGSRLTMANPTVILAGPKASGLIRSVTSAGRGQRQDVGARMIHAAPETASTVVARTIAGNGGHCHHRGLLRVEADAVGVTGSVRCDALVLDPSSVAEAELGRHIDADDAVIDERNTSVGLDDRQLFYLMSRGLTRAQAAAVVVDGFIEPVTRSVPMEYAVEWSRLVELRMESSAR